MKQIFLIFTFFMCQLNCFGQTMTKEEIEAFYSKFDNAYKNREWQTVLQFCDTVDYYKLNFTYDIIKAEALAGLERYDEAINYLESRFNNGEKLYYITNTLGNIYWIKGDLDNAILYYETTIDVRPTYARPYISLGHIYQQTEQTEMAIAYFMDAIELFYSHDFLDEVEQFTKKIIAELDSTYIEAYLYLERTFHKKGNYEDAMRVCVDIDEWCKQHEEEQIIYMVNQFHGGENTFFLQDYDKSIGFLLDYLKLLEQNPKIEDNNECETYVYLGVIAEYAEEYQIAEECFQKAKELNEEKANLLLKAIHDNNNNVKP